MQCLTGKADGDAFAHCRNGLAGGNDGVQGQGPQRDADAGGRAEIIAGNHGAGEFWIA
ncbi:hypothetical protein D9M68_746440 [compost metagenome]